MIYIAADTHSEIDMDKVINYFDDEMTYENLTKDDYLIILGDVSFDYNPWLIRTLQSLPVTVLFIDGNHDNIDLLNEYDEEMWCGGKVHFIEEDIIHLMRGQVYEIEGNTFFSFGGGMSIDKDMRREGYNWWSDEMPSEEEYEEGIINLEQHNYTVDYVLTHSGPLEIVEEIVGIYYPGEERLQEYLQDIKVQLDYKEWYFGHFHEDYEGDGCRCIYQDIIKIDN